MLNQCSYHRHLPFELTLSLVVDAKWPACASPAPNAFWWRSCHAAKPPELLSTAPWMMKSFNNRLVSVHLPLP